MGLLFQRSIRVSFGLADQPFTVVKGLFMQFDVEKTSEKTPNRVRIQITNLNETSRSTLEQKNVIVRLEAGYQNQLDELFIGNISRGSSERGGHDWVTSIEAGDGEKAFGAAQVNTTLGPGANTKQVLETLATALGKGIGSIKGVLDTDIFQNGITLTGDVSQRIDEITDKMGLEWSIQDDKLQVLPPDVPSEEIGIILTPETGLIGSPVRREEAKKGGKFLEFNALLRAQIKPGISLRIQSREVDGFFKIRKAQYSGDNRKGPFNVKCEAKEVPSGGIQTSQVLNIGSVA